MSGGCQSFPHSTRSVPTSFDLNSKPELIQGNISRYETFLGGSHRNISVPVQKLVQRSQGRGVGNMLKPLEGGYELPLTHQELSGSGEDNRTLRRIECIVLLRQVQKDKELAEEPNYFIYRPEERGGNDPSLVERSPSGINKLKPTPRSVQREAQRTSEEAERSQEQSRQG
ncbi:hypothetical protein O181_083950 [Austropuccinia psidii MF-1]|uniref:Uncharacterized protein n=1 Tax=Austropuccinia psidii MF-1 TaxID=1389203 RepID=A0A9Q3FUP8_9BASI|nr:hypothetical protein [Austropuccinia psidii MF-1]